MSLYSFKQVALEFNPVKSRRDWIKEVLEYNSTWEDVEPYFLPSGVEGSRFYDQQQVVSILRKVSVSLAKTRGCPDPMTDNGKLIPARSLWEDVYYVVRKNGFKFTKGRITGLLGYDEQVSDAESEQTTDVE